METKGLDSKGLESMLGHRFQDPGLLHEALTHSSYVNENPKISLQSNERLEFLGDAVLALAISHLLMRAYPQADEGQLSKMRSMLVKEDSLAQKARQMRLGDYLLLGKGEQITGGRGKDSLLANAFEAIVGALYMDAGFETACRFIRRTFERDLAEVSEERRLYDYKTRLQEITQALHKEAPIYRVVSEQGPDHQKRFVVELQLGDGRKTTGYGKSKKEAEQHAAREMLIILDGEKGGGPS